MQLGLFLVEAGLVLLIQAANMTKAQQDIRLGKLPDAIVFLVDVLFAAGDHLIGDLDEESSHALASVVVVRGGVNHANGVDEARNRLQDFNLKRGT